MIIKKINFFQFNQRILNCKMLEINKIIVKILINLKKKTRVYQFHQFKIKDILYVNSK